MWLLQENDVKLTTALNLQPCNHLALPPTTERRLTTNAVDDGIVSEVAF